jgi:HEAT repeat protein
MRAQPFALLTAVALLPVLAPPTRAVDTDEEFLRAAGLRTDDAGLIDFFDCRSRPSVTQDRLTALVRQLGEPSTDKQQRAVAELVALGSVALPLLRQAVKDPDDATRALRARQCLRLLDGEQASALPSAAARVLGRRRPAGAAAALLAYLPLADDEAVQDDVRAALVALAVRNGQPEPALVQALADPMALRRATAAEALGQTCGAAVQPQLRALLTDPRPAVRLRVALTLARDVKEAEAVDVLIALLADAPLGEARRAEDYLQTLAGDQAPKATLAADAAARQRCRDAWAAWWRGTSSPTLLDEIQRRTVTDETHTRAVVLLRQLGDPSFAMREKAMSELRGMGPSIALLLRQHTQDPDQEVSARAARLLEGTRGAPGPLPPVVVRLVALRKPAGAVAALLAFLPMNKDAALVDEVQEALAALAVRDGKLDPVLRTALADPLPLRRAVAAAAVWEAGLPLERPAARRLLNDPDAEVRRRVALAVAGSRDREAIPVLIALLTDVPARQAVELEEYLQRVAGEAAPDVRPGDDDATRRKCRDAWATWWRAHGTEVDLPSAAEARQVLLGYTLIVFQNPLRVAEIGPDLKQRWEFSSIGYTYDVQQLAGGRVLLAEWGAARVTERTTHGEVVWQKQVVQPINCQRLANGHTVIGTRMGLVVVDRSGTEVFSLQRPQGDLRAARRARDGSVVWVTNQGLCQRLDPAGKELKSFSVGEVSMGGLELLPTGHVLVSQCNDSRVTEYDGDGRSVWSAPVPVPASAVRLPNGHTLVIDQRHTAVVELDRAGKTVWEFGNGEMPWRARRR